MKIVILVVAGILVVLIIIDGLIRLWRRLFRPCGLAKQILLPDTCTGACPPGSICGPVPGTQVPYGPWGLLGVQDSVCACVLPPAAPGTPAGGVAPPASGSTTALPPPTTDANRPVQGDSRPVQPMPPGTPVQPSPEQEVDDRKKNKERIRLSEKGCNCIGFTFGQGNWHLDTDEVPKILQDNYAAVPAGRCEVCNIIVWKTPDGKYDHAGLVVEVDANGRPKTVRSKASISDFVYDHPPEVEPYGASYEVYARKSTDGLDQATKDEIKRLRDEYDAIADKSSRQARDAAERLCKKKNGLKGTGN